MKKIFESQDFPSLTDYSQLDAAMDANIKLNKLIESWQVVYGTLDEDTFKASHPYMSGLLQKDTHKARLAFIEEVSPEPPEEYHYVESGFSINKVAYVQEGEKMKTESLENELSKISTELSNLASFYGKDEETFLDSIETVDAEIAQAVIPLLKKKIHLLKQLWKIKVTNEGHSNLFLFTRSKK